MRFSVTARGAAALVVRFALLLSCVFLFSCAAVPERTHPAPLQSAPCLPDFPDRDGWYGGDGAYSIRLDDRRVLWLFGDTFVSDQQDRQDRMGMEVVLGTTMALSTCTDRTGFKIRYFLKRKNGKFISSFGDEEWLWPQAPFMADRTLYIPLISIRANPEVEGPFKFEIVGHKFARIKDFEGADPNRWAVDYIDLTPGIPMGVKAFATTSVVHRDHVYYYPLYSTTEKGLFILGNILARIPKDRLEDPAGAIEYLTAEGRWEKDPAPERIKIVMDASASEMSVRYHAEKRKWIAVYLSVRNNGDQMLYRTSDALEGPWSQPRPLIAAIPEVTPGNPRFDRSNFCYAGKEHPAFAGGGKLVVTYVCNSYEEFEMDSSFIRRNLFLYRPVVANPLY